MELAGGKERCRVSSRPGSPITFTPDSRYLVKANDGEFIFWDAETGKEARRFAGPQRPLYLASLPTATRLPRPAWTTRSTSMT